MCPADTFQAPGVDLTRQCAAVITVFIVIRVPPQLIVEESLTSNFKF